jgi:capsular exopolysaccharide synthesis family protein
VKVDIHKEPVLPENGAELPEDLSALLSSRSDTAHSYETLLNSLSLLRLTRPLNTILVTSSRPGEGKTTITINLALTMMLAGKRVLMVDTDLRKPRLHRAAHSENLLGFTDILVGNRDIQDAIRVVSVPSHTSTGDRVTDLKLCLISSGSVYPNAMKSMSVQRLQDTIERLKEQFDVVLFDSSPVLAVSDALLFASLVDGILLVLHAGVVTIPDARRAKTRLEQAGGHLLGVVMNRFIEGVHGSGYHPYQSYYCDQSL